MDGSVAGVNGALALRRPSSGGGTRAWAPPLVGAAGRGYARDVAAGGRRRVERR
jgi:hypothetical protein